MLCPLISIVNNILFKILIPAQPRLTYQNLRSFWLPPRHTCAVIFPRIRLISSFPGEEFRQVRNPATQIGREQ
jgi:hypothetical protein